MTRAILIWGAVGALLLGAARAEAGTVTIDFESEAHPTVVIGIPWGIHTEDGFDVSTASLRVLGSAHSAYTGSASAYAGAWTDITLEHASGAAFGLLSMDVGRLNGFSNDFDVAFTGYKSGGGTVSQSFTVNTAMGTLQTFNFSGFSGLSKVVWTQGGGLTLTNLAHQFDNIVVSTVPLPATVWMGLGLLGGIGLIGRLRRRRHAP